MDAIQNVSIPLIAVILILQVVLQGVMPALAKRKADRAPDNPPTNGTKAVMAHQINSLEQRSHQTADALTALRADIVALARAIDRLSKRIEHCPGPARHPTPPPA